MKKLGLTVLLSILTLPVLAADYRPEPAPAMPAANPWSRPYIGVFGGVGAGTNTLRTDAIDGDLAVTTGGLEAGIRAGYDYAHGSFLIGAVGDYAISNIGLAGRIDVPGFLSTDAEYRLSSLGTLRARLGVTMKNNLFYAHGGAAAGTVSVRVGGNDVPGLVENPRLGFVVGAGHEYAFSQHGTIQTEYSYVQMGEFDVYSAPGLNISDQFAFHKLSTGVNFRF